MSNLDYTKYAKISNEAPVEPAVEAPAESVTEEIVEPKSETTAEPISESEVVTKPEPEIAIEPTPEPEAIVEAKEPEIVQTRKIGRVFGCAKLNVRKAPKPKADIVCEINCHTEVEIDEDESTEDFYKIYTTSGIEGFCMKSYILEK